MSDVLPELHHSCLIMTMEDKQTIKAKLNRDKLAQVENGEKHTSWKDKLSLSNLLADHPVLFSIGAIIALAIIAILVWVTMRRLQLFLRSREIKLFSMDAGLSNWFSLFVSYTGAVATVVLGILTARLTIKQSQSSDYAAISELRLDNFLICDLWQKYIPTNFDGDRGRRFVLTFNITGLKTYYNIARIRIAWGHEGTEPPQFIDIKNQDVLYQSTSKTKVTAYFDDIPDCNPRDSINYFMRLGLYEPGMMTLEEKRRWIRVYIKLDYADNKTTSDVYCNYLLEYNGLEDGRAYPEPIDHKVKIYSFKKPNIGKK